MGITLALLLVCSIPIQTVQPFEGTATSEHPDSNLRTMALSDAMGKALDHLSSSTGMLFSARERKHLLARASRFVVRQEIISSGYNGAAYVFSARFYMDFSGIIREITAIRHRIPRIRVRIWYRGIGRAALGDLKRLFPSQLYDVRFLPARRGLPRRRKCPRRIFCLGVTLEKDGERVMLTYVLRRRRHKDVKVQVAAYSPSMALTALPDEILAVLRPHSFSSVTVEVTGLEGGFDILRFLEVLKEQKGALFDLDSYTMDGGRVKLSLRMVSGVSVQAVFDGLYLGDGIRTTLFRDDVGRWKFSVMPPQPPSPKEEKYDIEERQ